MEVVKIEKQDEVYNKIHCDPGVAYEINDHFTFEVPGAKFMPLVRNKVWDGKIRLFNPMASVLYGGLNHHLEKFCKARKYEVEYASDFSLDEFSLKEARDFIDTLGIPDRFEIRDYQVEAFTHAVREKRSLLLSPTASGKSLIIYYLVRYYDARTLIIVPTTSLVRQLASDFGDYGYGSDSNVHRIYAGEDKRTDKPITISTWQSIYKLPKEYFQQFDVIVGDEAHLFKAKSLTSIMTKMTTTKYRFGFTGTLDGTQTNQLILEGLFGPVRKVVSTSELIEQKHLASFQIKAIILKYPDEDRKLLRAASYQEELDYLVTNQYRNRFIKNLVLSLKRNTLVLFQFVEKHGDVLYKMIKDETTRPVYFVSGRVEGEAREEIRKIVEDYKSNDTIILEFPDFTLKIDEKQSILLTNGEMKLVEQVTEEDDVDTGDCINRIQASTLVGQVEWTTKRSTKT